MPHLFISYAKKDTRELALELTDKLNEIAGITAWVDRSLKAGRSWELQIQREIDRCDTMIVLYSPDINRHKDGKEESYVLTEIHYAKRIAQKQIIPVMAQETDPPMALMMEQYIDYTLDGLRIDDLVEAVCEELGVKILKTTEQGLLQANTMLFSRYKIEGQIGGGGQSVVYQARDLNFPEARRLVAIKEMLLTDSDPNLRAATIKTFQREANILATLNHPVIPRVYDFFSQNDRAYLIMEYINGRDLEAILVKTKSLPMNKIIEWAIELCDVLYYLHNHQPEPIIYRDMKPANVMIDSLARIRLVDFGIAKIFVSGLPQTMIGTEGYSAPEQYRGKATPLSDIFSLGTTLHHVITRTDPRLEPPFSFAERPITTLNPDATPELETVIMKALEFEPENRYSSCAEMKADLEAIVLPS